jgi:hypothetical protein
VETVVVEGITELIAVVVEDITEFGSGGSGGY